MKKLIDSAPNDIGVSTLIERAVTNGDAIRKPKNGKYISQIEALKSMINKNIQFKFKHDFSLDPFTHGLTRIGTTCPGGIDNSSSLTKRVMPVTVGLDFLKC